MDLWDTLISCAKFLSALFIILVGMISIGCICGFMANSVQKILNCILCKFALLCWKIFDSLRTKCYLTSYHKNALVTLKYVPKKRMFDVDSNRYLILKLWYDFQWWNKCLYLRVLIHSSVGFKGWSLWPCSRCKTTVSQRC